MNKTILPVAFFFGANNKEKYVSLYNEIYSPYKKGNYLILKGGPGTGKSTIMKKIAQKLESKGYYTERGYCSADPNSIDVVAAPEINFSILDGTSPHTMDPTLPGVYEHIVDLSVAWNKNILKGYATEIGEAQKKNQLIHKKVAEYLKVSENISKESAEIYSRFTDKEKADRYALRLSKRYIPKKRGAVKGREYRRFLSGITPDGVYTHHDTVAALSEEIITVEDNYGVLAPRIAEIFSEEAITAGYKVYKCLCPLFGGKKTEHIIIPELKLTLFTQNKYHRSLTGDIKNIKLTRFTDDKALWKNKEKLSFLEQTKKELIDEAVKNLGKALKIHDELEKYYIEAMNFDAINEISNNLLFQI